MPKILVTGAGSAQANSVIHSLLKVNTNDVVGCGSDKYDLIFSPARKNYLIPHSTDETYDEYFLRLLKTEAPNVLYVSHDKELWKLSRIRDQIANLGVRFLAPDTNDIENCVFKFNSWKIFRQANIAVPESSIIESQSQLKKIFSTFDSRKKGVWLRSNEIGGGGKGAYLARNVSEANDWIEKNNGWGKYIIAEVLSKDTITYSSIWKDGVLLGSQLRSRDSWAFASLAPTGVTGITRVCRTTSNQLAQKVSLAAIKAISERPNGIFSVDMTFSEAGVPNPTEINIGRFFTTIHFFTLAGFNMPQLYVEASLSDQWLRSPIINPLEDNLLWIRSIDAEPMLLREDDISKYFTKL